MTVSGLIEAATVICGRNLSVQCGMAAAGDRGCLYVGGDAEVGYLKNVHGLVKGDLLVRREMINCELGISRNVMCESGEVIGGMLCVSGSTVIGTLGSATGTPTSVTFGSHPCQQQTAGAFSADTAPGQTAEARKSSAEQSSTHLAKLTEQIRSCRTMQSGEFVIGNAKNADLTVMKTLHASSIIRTGRCRVVIERASKPDSHQRQRTVRVDVLDAQSAFSHPLTDLATPLRALADPAETLTRRCTAPNS